MQFEGSIIKEQGVTFGIIIVKPYVLNSQSEKEKMTAFGHRVFGIMPIILMAQNSRGIPTYYGRRDIVDFLASLHPSQIPWKRYNAA